MSRVAGQIEKIVTRTAQVAALGYDAKPSRGHAGIDQRLLSCRWLGWRSTAALAELGIVASNILSLTF